VYTQVLLFAAFFNVILSFFFFHDLAGNLTFKPFFASLLSFEPNDLEFDIEDRPLESSIKFDTFIVQMNYDNINITTVKNQ
jgi:hypothetical protein